MTMLIRKTIIIKIIVYHDTDDKFLLVEMEINSNPSPILYVYVVYLNHFLYQGLT